MTWSRDILINVNFPPVPSNELAGIEITHKGRRKIWDEVIENKEIWETLHQEALDESSKFSWKNIAEDFEQFLDKLN